LESNGSTKCDHVGLAELSPGLSGVPGIDDSVITKQLENLKKGGGYAILNKVVAKVTPRTGPHVPGEAQGRLRRG
jgi:hypothetical protein